MDNESRHQTDQIIDGRTWKVDGATIARHVVGGHLYVAVYKDETVSVPTRDRYFYLIETFDRTGGTTSETYQQDTSDTPERALELGIERATQIDYDMTTSERRALYVIEDVAVGTDNRTRIYEAWAAFDQDGDMVEIFRDKASAEKWWGRELSKQETPCLDCGEPAIAMADAYRADTPESEWWAPYCSQCLALQVQAGHNAKPL